MKGGDSVPHIHDVIDSDSHFHIDPVTRSITTKSDKLYVVQYDHDSEQFTFQVPRYVEEHDMSQCSRIEVHFTNVTRTKKQQNDGVYFVRKEDIINDYDTVFFKWLVSRDATQLVGSLKFTITFICVDEEDTVSYQWSTGMFESIEVLTKLEHTSAVVKAYPDLYTALKQDIINSIPEGSVDAEEVERIIAEYLEANGSVTIDQVTPDKVVFPDGVTTTYAIGKVSLVNGSGTLIEPGGTLADFFDVFVDEKIPTTIQPSVTLTFTQGKAYEVGTTVTPVYTASLNPGKYTYGPDTGVTAVSWEVTDNTGNSSDSPTGSFSDVHVTDESNYVITAKVNHTAGTVPVTNTGNEYPSGQITAGEKSATASVSLTGFRRSFYGAMDTKEELTSDVIRGLPVKTEKALSNGASFTIDFPVGAMRVVFAYPATLRDVTSVKDVNGLNADITNSFKMELIDVAGANNYDPISYKVYVLDFAKANDAANTFAVTM